MSSSVRGGGGELTMYLKHWELVSDSIWLDKALVTYIQTLRKLLLLLVNYAKPEINFVGLFKVRLHLHNLRECFLGVLQ